MKEVHIEVPRSARYFELGPPAEDAAEIWYVCHGYRQLANRFLRRFHGVKNASRLIVAPEGSSRFYLEGGEEDEHNHSDRVGASWMTREDRLHEIDDYVRYLDLLRARVEAPCDAEGLRRVVFGFSQGVHTVCRWVVLGDVAPDDLILWGAYVPTDLPDGAVASLNRSRITIVRGTADPYIPDDRHAAQLQRMEDMGLRFDVIEHPGAHEVHVDTLNALSQR